MSRTHYDGQALADCPECGTSARLNPPGEQIDDEARVTCDNCGEEFYADRETGEVIDS